MTGHNLELGRSSIFSFSFSIIWNQMVKKIVKVLNGCFVLSISRKNWPIQTFGSFWNNRSAKCNNSSLDLNLRIDSSINRIGFSFGDLVFVVSIFLFFAIFELWLKFEDMNPRKMFLNFEQKFQNRRTLSVQSLSNGSCSLFVNAQQQ